MTAGRKPSFCNGGSGNRDILFGMSVDTVKLIAVRFWRTSFLVAVVLWYSPYVDVPVRLLTWVAIAVSLGGAVIVYWGKPVIRWSLLGLYAAAILFLVCPFHRPVDRPALQSRYCAALKSYMGCHYVWGGQGYFGIDCSGFVQKGMMDALATRGLTTFDPSLLRDSLSLYWHRTTAKVIGEGFAGRTAVTTCTSLNALDYALLQPGDMAVTAVGDHVMAYLGNRMWIAADPGAGKVTTFTIPEPKNAYFFTPMRIVRWKTLAE
jgi:hypothetical protein